MIQMTVKVSKLMIDTRKIQDRADRAKRGAITRQLGWLRTTARRSMRRRKRVSQPGQPPSIHSSDPVANLKAILYVYEPATDSGIVGPRYVNSSLANIKNSEPLPSLMETGGTMRVYEEEVHNAYTGERFWRRVDRRRKKNDRRKRYRRVAVKARPFMGPALNKGIQSGAIMAPWRDSFTD